MFKDVIGQPLIHQELVQMVTHNRLSHALLFLGREGVGSLPLAIALAQYLVCEKRLSQPDDQRAALFDPTPVSTIQDACGTCPSCTKSRAFVHPDIHFSFPVVTRKSGVPPVSVDYIKEWREFLAKYPYGNIYDWLQYIGAENKQGNITANECNEILRRLSLKSFESGYKILILWMPEYLGNEGNKLLKVIEEPPPNTLFVLVGENESLILPTIVSRTQTLRIPPPDAEALLAALIAAGASATSAKQALGLSGGNVREAFFLIRQTGEDWSPLLREWLNSILKTGPSAQVKWIEEISRLGRENQKQFLRFFIHVIDNALRSRILNIQLDDLSLRLNQVADIAQLQAIVEELDNAALYIERNANPRILFHALTIKLYNILAHRKITQVV